jgi:O-antigen ligase
MLWRSTPAFGLERLFVSGDMNDLSKAAADWVALGLLSLSLFAAVLLRGGVYPSQWAWSAIGVGLALLMAASVASAGRPTRDITHWLLVALAAWMFLQLIPLPPSVVAVLSPERWSATSAARSFTRADPRAWAALSVVPGATFERLADVVPAMAAFFAVRTLSPGWRASKWWLVAPVILAAWLESILGMLQFRAMRSSPGLARLVTGTYVNRDHFAALLEMAFPLALLWAVTLWRRWKARRADSFSPVLATIGLSSIAACLLLGITFSSSRMAFISSASAGALVAGILVSGWAPRRTMKRIAWRWAAAIVLPACLVVVLPTSGLLDRYRDLAGTGQALGNPRVEIWRDTVPMIAAYRWVGCGLGAFEYGFYRFNLHSPMDTVDFAHNDFLQIAAELGLIGAGLAVALALWIAWHLVKIVLRERGVEDWELAIGLLGALFAIGLHSFVEFNLYIPANALVVAWLCGMADSLSLRQRPLLS